MPGDRAPVQMLASGSAMPADSFVVSTMSPTYGDGSGERDTPISLGDSGQELEKAMKESRVVGLNNVLLPETSSRKSNVTQMNWPRSNAKPNWPNLREESGEAQATISKKLKVSEVLSRKR